MNILYICDEYPPGQNGGIGSVVQTLARELVKQGHHVFVVGLYSFQYGEKNYEEDEGVKIWRLRYGLKLPINSGSRIYNIFKKNPDFIKKQLNGKKAFNRFIQFINDLIKKEKIDVIEIPDFNNFVPHIGFKIEWPFFTVPLILKSHGSYTYVHEALNTKPKKNVKNSDIALFKRADSLSNVSDYIDKKNRKIFDLHQNTKILYNGIPLVSNNSEIVRDKATVLFTGSLNPIKGINSLMKAWNIVNDIIPEAKLYIYGKGKSELYSKLLKPNVIPSVKFEGHVNRDQLFNHLQKATIAVFPSYSETFGLGVVEAMSVECPVIYTKRSCGPEIVNHEIDGILVDPDNINEIADKILFLLQNKDVRTEYAKAALLSVKERFDIKKSALNHISYYKDVITTFNKI